MAALHKERAACSGSFVAGECTPGLYKPVFNILTFDQAFLPVFPVKILTLEVIFFGWITQILFYSPEPSHLLIC